jgi:ABC-type dipeptide/oligopeptide/nickel transport system permease component
MSRPTNIFSISVRRSIYLNFLISSLVTVIATFFKPFPEYSSLGCLLRSLHFSLSWISYGSALGQNDSYLWVKIRHVTLPFIDR